MKTIIVPTNFSAEANTAIAYAASLAMVSGSTILLLSVYQLPVTMHDFPVLMVSVDELKSAADAGLSRIKEEAQKQFTALQFETESRLGYVSEEIEAIAKDWDIFCVVVGTQKLSGLENLLQSNDAVSLMKNSLYPVIAVPEGIAAKAPKNIVLAIDDTDSEKIPVQKISAFVTALNAQLHIVHVELIDEEPIATNNLLESFS